MDIETYRLHFHNALHTGRRGIGIEETDHRLTADTIFAALLTQLALREPALVDELVAAFPTRRGADFTPGDPPFLLTSAFPFVGTVLLFPNPNLLKGGGDGIDKTFKKVKYVSQSIFLALLSGSSLPALGDKALSFQGGEVWIDQREAAGLPKDLPEGSDLWATERRPRVAIDRETSQSQIFHHGQVVYREGCGLWFGIHWREAEYPLGDGMLPGMVRLLLADLSVVGIGGLRSHGLGAFTLEEGSALTLPDAEQAGAVVCLSRFHPAPADMVRFDHPQAAYRLSQVGGWMHATGYADQERLSVTMLDEGAVLGGGLTVAGCLVDTSPASVPHPSWRYGLLFPAGLANGR